MTALARTDDHEPVTGPRRIVLDGTAGLFRSHGYSAIGMRDIAAACGIKIEPDGDA